MLNELTCEREKITQLIHYLAAVIGGFVGCYAVMIRADFFGNAQTSNMLYLIIAILGKTPKDVLIRAVGVCIYVLGTMGYVFLKKAIRFNIKIIALCIDILCVVTLACIPTDIEPIVGLYPIFFAMSFQWNAFPGAYGYTSSTIFSTNNIRQIALSFAEYIVERNRKHLHKLFFFLGTIIGFHIGVAFAYICVIKLSIEAIWFALIPIVLAFAAVIYEQTLECTETSKIHNTCNIV